nr:uncharacterized protein LOC115260840 [Aedes albopictus]
MLRLFGKSAIQINQQVRQRRLQVRGQPGTYSSWEICGRRKKIQARSIMPIISEPEQCLRHGSEGVEQGIDDMQTFVELDNNDFSRLMLRTKVIKLIQRIQKELYDDMVIEERLEEDDHENGESSKESAKNDEDALEGSNDFQGITLEKVNMWLIRVSSTDFALNLKEYKI